MAAPESLLLPLCQALDKIRYMSLTDPDALGEGETRELDIKASLPRRRLTRACKKHRKTHPLPAPAHRTAPSDALTRL